MLAAAGEHLLPLLARLLPCPVARRALARPPHRAPPPRVPAPPRLPPPCLTRALWRGRARVSGTDGAATAPAVAAPPSVARASLLRPSALAPPTQSAVAPRLKTQPTPFPRPRRAVWCV